MPFGLTNGLATFFNFIYDVDIQWKAIATSSGVTINEEKNTSIIVNDIISHGKDLDSSLKYVECQLCVCLAYHLLLSLRKSHIFLRGFKFVGNDVCVDGNHPAQSKHQLLSTWPKPKLVKDIAKFIGFVQFYSKSINRFELRVTPLHKLIINNEYTNPVAPIWSDTVQNALNN